MNELKHWLEDTSDADEFERSVLHAGLAADPPPGAEDAVWSGVLGALALTAVPAATSGLNAASVKTTVTGASKVTAVWLGVGKGFVLGLAIYGATAGANEIAAHFNAPAPRTVGLSRAASPPPTRISKQATASAQPPLLLDAPSPTPTDGRTSTEQATNAQHSPAPVPAELPSRAAFPDPPPASNAPNAPASPLQAEADALRRARAELRAGKLADAFATLEASRRQFSAPALYQEREALLIELLFRSGQVATAQQRAAAFVEQFPDSPHTAAIGRLAH